MAVYFVENQWGGSHAPWHNGGSWVLGGRRGQNVVAIDIRSNDGGNSFEGQMTYAGEGPIGFKAAISGGNAYLTENQWGGSHAPWHPGGVWVIGARGEQHVVSVNVSSRDSGNTLEGTNTYAGEGPIGFRGVLRGDNAGSNYTVENQWGGSYAPWHPGGNWVLGTRGGAQSVVEININSNDGGNTLGGQITYAGEGPIGFRGSLL